MHLTYFLLIVVFLIPLARALFNETSSVKSINSAAELAEAYFGVEYLTAFLYYCGNSRSEFLAPFYQEFAEANKEFYRFYAVDCDLIQNTENNEIIPACQEEFRDSLPQIFFIEPNEELPDETSDKIPAPKYHRYEGDIAVEDFEKFAKKLMPSFAEKLVSLEDLDKFLANQPELNKVLFLANKKSLPQYWKALTAHYRDRLSVIISLCSNWRINLFDPSLERYSLKELKSLKNSMWLASLPLLSFDEMRPGGRKSYIKGIMISGV